MESFVWIANKDRLGISCSCYSVLCLLILFCIGKGCIYAIY